MNPRFNSDNSLAHRVCNSIYDIRFVLEKTKDPQITYELLDDLLKKAVKELTDEEFGQYSMQNLNLGGFNIEKAINNILHKDNERELYMIDNSKWKIKQEH